MPSVNEEHNSMEKRPGMNDQSTGISDAGDTGTEDAQSRYRDLPIVAIIGRPNVGKSTLFNRIVRGRIAIVDDEPGVTRDRNYREAHWAGKRFFVVDTGGLVPKSKDTIETLVRKQVEAAIAEAALVVLVVDATVGRTPLDEEIADLVRKADKQHVLVANKVDSKKAKIFANEFYALGLGNYIEASAEHGTSIGEVLDEIVAHIPAVESESGHVAAIAVVGKPNVGKSSLVNRLAGSDTMIVDDTPGTTRDAVDSYVDTKYGVIKLVDTAGLRRKSRADSDLEKHANLRSVSAIDRSEVVVLMLDAESGLTKQDLTIASYVEQSGKAMVLVWNKWDLHGDGEREKFDKEVRQRFRHQPYLPVVFVSCKTGEGIDRLVDKCFEVHASWDTRLPTGILNRTLEPHLRRKPPKSKGRRVPKIYYVAQMGTKPPTFALLVNDPALISENYKRFIEKRIRALYPFEGTPLRIRVRKSK
jgi:GTP-binding protein